MKLYIYIYYYIILRFTTFHKVSLRFTRPHGRWERGGRGQQHGGWVQKVWWPEGQRPFQTMVEKGYRIKGPEAWNSSVSNLMQDDSDCLIWFVEFASEVLRYDNSLHGGKTTERSPALCRIDSAADPCALLDVVKGQANLHLSDEGFLSSRASRAMAAAPSLRQLELRPARTRWRNLITS